jgi:putative ABC transport system permease protein
MRAAAPCYTVVGVTGRVHRWRVVEGPRAGVFYPVAQGLGLPHQADQLIVRARPERTATVMADVRRALAAVAPTGAIPEVVASESVIAPQYRPWKVGAWLFGALGFLALVVATVGVYSVIAYATGQRTHEMAVRASLGATRRDNLVLVLRSGTRLVMLGTLFGVGAAVLLGRVIESSLYGVSSTDPVTFACAILVLFMAGVVASAVPAWRTRRIEPAVTLRAM